MTLFVCCNTSAARLHACPLPLWISIPGIPRNSTKWLILNGIRFSTGIEFLDFRLPPPSLTNCHPSASHSFSGCSCSAFGYVKPHAIPPKLYTSFKRSNLIVGRLYHSPQPLERKQDGRLSFCGRDARLHWWPLACLFRFSVRESASVPERLPHPALRHAGSLLLRRSWF